MSVGAFKIQPFELLGVSSLNYQQLLNK